MPTRAVSVTGTGGTAARATTQIGSNIILPSGGPWIISGVWGQVAKVTAVTDEGTGGELIVRAVSGDLDPDPSPGIFPLIGAPAQMGANHGLAALPLNIWPVNWEAAGRASISLSYRQQLDISAASQVRAGLIFGKEIPEKRPIKFSDSVQASFASATEQSIGSITLAEKATRITGILAMLNKGDAVTVAEPVIGIVRLASSDLLLPPAQFPFNVCFDSADGTPAGETGMPQSQYIPVDIEITGGAIIDVFATTDISVTGNADVSVFLAYE